MLPYDNCPNCFQPLNGQPVCPHCGNDPSKNKQYPSALPPFTQLSDRYLTGRVLGKGGFGITYVAKDISANRICAIKEYMPTEYSAREGGTRNVIPFSQSKAQLVFNHGREKFMEEAKTLVRLRDNPGVVDILNYFRQNNTAYLVMEYLDGQNLREMAKNNGGKIDPDTAKLIFVSVASCLMEVHRLNILHRDLSPENIIVTKSGQIKLIDFGAARNYVSLQNKGMSILLKVGFAPPEQYNTKGCQGPWTDVYALCATFYTLVSGQPLVDAMFRYRGAKLPSLISLGCPVTKKTSDVIERGLELDYKRRYRNFKELLDDIDIELPPKSIDTSQDTGEDCTPPPAPIKSSPYVAAIVGKSICKKMPIAQNSVLRVGRSVQSCQYVISGDTSISRTHCELRFDGKNIYLKDVSANGTFFANGIKLVRNREYIVPPGTRIFLATRKHMLVLDIAK